MHVVQRHHQAAAGPAELRQQRRHRPVESETVRGCVHRRGGRLGTAAAEGTGDRVQQTGREGRAGVQVGERVGEGMEREMALVLGRPAAQHGHPASPRAQAELGHQPALADSRRAGEVDEGRGPMAQSVDHRVEKPQFGRAADEGTPVAVPPGSVFRCSRA